MFYWRLTEKTHTLVKRNSQLLGDHYPTLQITILH